MGRAGPERGARAMAGPVRGRRDREHPHARPYGGAIECLRQLVDVAPAVFSDFEISVLSDGTEVATSPLATEV